MAEKSRSAAGYTEEMWTFFRGFFALLDRGRVGSWDGRQQVNIKVRGLRAGPRIFNSRSDV